jgi:SCF-associated factor 1
MHVGEDVGIIVDIQCGGWSTTVLTSDGKLFTVGILDASNAQHTGHPVSHLTQLQKFGQFQVTGVRHFSAGRCHVLGLDDDGYVWSWDNAEQAGCLLSFQNSLSYARQATRVVAGWVESSAYIPGKGIIFWPAVSTRRDQDVQGYDRSINESLVPATGYRRSVGSTAQPPMGHERLPDVEGDVREEDVGEVLAHVVLEGYIVFITHLNKLFACGIGGDSSRQPATTEQNPQQILRSRVFEIPGYASEGRDFKDIQGSFRNFAVFTANGEVLAGHTDYLNQVFAERCDAFRRGITAPNEQNMQYPQALLDSRPADIPALQHTGVIAVAFGDYHSHALHADGTITAYGVEPGCCGALGLGSTAAGARFRGVKTSRTPRDRDGRLLPIANRRGRQVWFEHEKRDWLQWLENWIRTPTALPHYPEVFAILNDLEEKQAAFSEWIEQEGRHWVDGPLQTVVDEYGNSQTPGESATRTARYHQGPDINAGPPKSLNDELPAYFAISVAAAGWHTGALVLVDDEKAEETREKWLARSDETETTSQDRYATHMPGGFPTPSSSGTIREEYIWEKSAFPRIKLPDGYEFPGEGELRPWRDSMPTADELGLVGQAEN